MTEAELDAAVAEAERRARERRLEASPELRALDANGAAIRRLQGQLDEARSYRADLIEQALGAGLARAEVADAAGITARRLDAIRKAAR